MELAYQLQAMLERLQKETRVLSRSEDGMSVVVGVDWDWSDAVQYGSSPMKRHPFRKRR